jgi:hypothetical protein
LTGVIFRQVLLSHAPIVLTDELGAGQADLAWLGTARTLGDARDDLLTHGRNGGHEVSAPEIPI